MKSSTFGIGLRYSRLESTPRVPNIKQIVWNETRAIKFKTARISFSSDLFAVNEFDELFLSPCTTWSMMADKNNVLVSPLIIILIKMGVSKFCKWVQRSFLFLVDNFSNKEKEQTQMKLLKLSFYLHMIKVENKKSGETLGHMVLKDRSFWIVVWFRTFYFPSLSHKIWMNQFWRLLNITWSKNIQGKKVYCRLPFAVCRKCDSKHVLHEIGNTNHVLHELIWNSVGWGLVVKDMKGLLYVKVERVSERLKIACNTL